MKPEMIIYAGGLIGVVGAAIVVYGTLRQSQVANAEADFLRAKIDTLHEQNEKLKNITTGGDSYLKMFFVNIGNEQHKISIQNIGEYPLSETKMWFIDMNGWEKLTSDQAILRERESKKRILDIGYMPPKGQVEFDQLHFKLDKKLGVYLIVHFSANNGTSVQIIRMKWVDNKWAIANKYINGRNEPIYDISENYPRLEDLDDTFNNHY